MKDFLCIKKALITTMERLSSHAIIIIIQDLKILREETYRMVANMPIFYNSLLNVKPSKLKLWNALKSALYTVTHLKL